MQIHQATPTFQNLILEFELHSNLTSFLQCVVALPQNFGGVNITSFTSQSYHPSESAPQTLPLKTKYKMAFNNDHAHLFGT